MEPAERDDRLRLFYDFPAREILTEGLPLGNGALGVLSSGGVPSERWVLNEATLWSGGPYDPSRPGAHAALPEVQRLIFAGNYREAAVLAERELLGKPKWQEPYQPLGELRFECFGHERASDYRRELDLERAIAKTSYVVGGVRYERELFVSAVDQVLVARFSASRPGALALALGLSSAQRGLADWQLGPECWYTRGACGMRGRNRPGHQAEGALEFEFAARVLLEGGRALPGEFCLNVRDAQSLVVVAAAATNYQSFQSVAGDARARVATRLERAGAFDFETLRARHVAEYAPLFSRLRLELGSDPSRAQQPTDARVARYEQGGDEALAALYVQYARYLLLACSRPGGQPANLQGLWNEKLDPAWGSKCTVNINTEMNYWPAEPGALPECTEPLLQLVEELAESGRRTAQNHYAAGGWVCHHNLDLWRATAPVDGVEWGLWPTGGAWLCLHLWEHYEFSLDRSYLERAYPLLKGAAQFFLDSLVPYPGTAYRVTCPSISPENQHPHGSALCAGPTMDNAILRALFAATHEASEILGCDADFRLQLAAARGALPPSRVGRAGQLQEWMEDWDLQAPEPHHRHVSHLFGLHPGHEISVLHTPELAHAARRSLELRGDAATGWSLAWKVNLWARLFDAERAHQLLKLLLSPERTYTNLFDAHPPFQIDGNFGGAAGILEMLVQSRRGALHLLPALPEAWPAGSLSGVRARGALAVDLEWAERRLRCARLTSGVAQRVEVRIGTGEPSVVELEAGVATELAAPSRT